MLISEGWEWPPQASGEQRGLLSRHGATSRGSGVLEHPGAFGAASSSGTQRVLRVTGLGWGLRIMAPTPAVSLAPWGQLLHVGKVWFPSPPPSLGSQPFATGTLLLLPVLSPSSFCPRLCSLSRVPGRKETWL